MSENEADHREIPLGAARMGVRQLSDAERGHLSHMTDGRWHDSCCWCQERAARGGTGISWYDRQRAEHQGKDAVSPGLPEWLAEEMARRAAAGWSGVLPEGMPGEDGVHPEARACTTCGTSVVPVHSARDGALLYWIHMAEEPQDHNPVIGGAGDEAPPAVAPVGPGLPEWVRDQVAWRGAGSYASGAEMVADWRSDSPPAVIPVVVDPAMPPDTATLGMRRSSCTIFDEIVLGHAPARKPPGMVASILDDIRVALAAKHEAARAPRLKRGDQVVFTGSSTGASWTVIDLDLDTCTLERGSLTKRGVSMSLLERAPERSLASNPVS
ncbi:MAG: hypothetical protein JWM19_898 [Actinomycetia bacterium]|nr:hypothetical protein [Actinomycetes bacterium]